MGGERYTIDIGRREMLVLHESQCDRMVCCPSESYWQDQGRTWMSQRENYLAQESPYCARGLNQSEKGG